MACTATMKLGKRYPDLSYTKIFGKTRGYKRSKAAIKETPKTLTITITANDAAALRATLNTTIRDFNTVEMALSASKKAIIKIKQPSKNQR
jgi:tRNA threonylcarbamoyladenosine modification (KEOPS) complex  Pcc1 subunit